jgi:photosystem II stability/assembly factor-like uncharacterized protein
MKCSEVHVLTRRKLLAGLGVLASLPTLTRAADDRFAALNRAAPIVRQPARAVLLSADRAGRRIVSVGERGVICLSDDEARSWRQARSVPTSSTLTAVQFADERLGWAVGHGGIILHTEDGGESWRRQADGQALALLAGQRAQALAGEPSGPALAKEAALLLADGPDKPLLGLKVIDARKVVVAGAYNLFFETSDGGASWVSRLDGLENPRALHLYGVETRGDTWMLVGEQGLLLRSLDGGRRFARLKTPYAGSWFAVTSPSGREWVLAGLRGHVYRSIDDGDSWTALPGAAPASFVAATSMADGSVMLANQVGQIHMTRGGQPLQARDMPTLPSLTHVMPLADGGVLALSVMGAFRMDKRPA